MVIVYRSVLFVQGFQCIWFSFWLVSLLFCLVSLRRFCLAPFAALKGGNAEILKELRGDYLRRVRGVACLAI